jgi:hypothetical protein
MGAGFALSEFFAVPPATGRKHGEVFGGYAAKNLSIFSQARYAIMPK